MFVVFCTSIEQDIGGCPVASAHFQLSLPVFFFIEITLLGQKRRSSAHLLTTLNRLALAPTVLTAQMWMSPGVRSLVAVDRLCLVTWCPCVFIYHSIIAPDHSFISSFTSLTNILPSSSFPVVQVLFCIYNVRETLGVFDNKTRTYHRRSPVSLLMYLKMYILIMYIHIENFKVKSGFMIELP